jgi:hypothetical protein
MQLYRLDLQQSYSASGIDLVFGEADLPLAFFLRLSRFNALTL